MMRCAPSYRLSRHGVGRSKTSSPLAAALAEIRVSAGMTQEQLAVDAGVSLNSLRKIEQGDLRVNLSTLLKLLHFLNHDLSVTPKKTLGAGRADER